jgi:hypothetical protein
MTFAMERRLKVDTAKSEVESLLRRLPGDCTLEDIQYHLYVVEKVRRSIQSVDTQGTLTQEEVERRLSKWITSFSIS